MVKADIIDKNIQMSCVVWPSSDTTFPNHHCCDEERGSRCDNQLNESEIERFSSTSTRATTINEKQIDLQTKLRL